MKNAAIAAAFLAAICSPLFAAPTPVKPAPQIVGCDKEPHMIVNDKTTGRPSQAVFLCYRDDGVVVHTERALTFDEILALITPKPAADPAPSAPAAAPAAVPATASMSHIPPAIVAQMQARGEAAREARLEAVQKKLADQRAHVAAAAAAGAVGATGK